MKRSVKITITTSVIIVFTITYIIAFLVYPEMGEKILYGKHPPGKDSEILQYSDIILSEDYECLEAASLKARGDLPKFVKEFNECHS